MVKLNTENAAWILNGKQHLNRYRILKFLIFKNRHLYLGIDIFGSVRNWRRHVWYSSTPFPEHLTVFHFKPVLALANIRRFTFYVILSRSHFGPDAFGCRQSTSSADRSDRRPRKCNRKRTCRRPKTLWLGS